MVAVHVGSDDVAIEEDHGAVELGHVVVPHGVGIVRVAFPLFRPAGEVAAELFLLFAQHVDADALLFFDIAVGDGVVGHTYEKSRRIQANRSECVGGHGVGIARRVEGGDNRDPSRKL